MSVIGPRSRPAKSSSGFEVRNDAQFELVADSESQGEPLPLGEYFLHIYVIQTNRVVIDDGDFDGILKVKAFGQSKFSKVIPRVSGNDVTYWGEHFFFEKTFTSREELEEAAFEISLSNHRLRARLMNKKKFFDSNLIGTTSGNLLVVNQLPESALVNNWAVLVNPEVDPTKSYGFILYSANFTHSSQKKKNLEMQASLTKGLQNMFIPPSIKLRFKQLSLVIFKGKDLMSNDLMSKVDPVVEVEINGNVLYTKSHKDEENPDFNQKMMMSIVVPTVDETLNIRLLDQDLLGNEVLGSHTFRLRDVEGLSTKPGDPNSKISRKYEYPLWVPFYGAPKKIKFKEMAQEMRESYEMGSTYVGSLMLHMKLDPTERPIEEVRTITTRESENSKNFVDVDVRAIIDVVYVQGMFVKAKKAKLVVSWLDETFRSEEFSVQNGVILTNYVFKLSKTFPVDQRNLQKDLFEFIPPAILSVEVEGVCVSFYKFEASRFKFSPQANGRVLTISLRVDRSVVDARPEYGGRATVRASFDSQPRTEVEQLGWLPLARQKVLRGKLLIDLFQARDLLASDNSGTSDPVVQFYHLGSMLRSSVVKGSLAPCWNQQLVMQTNFFDLDPSANSNLGIRVPDLIVSVWDEDPSGLLQPEKFEFLGEHILQLSQRDLVSDVTELRGPPTPRWFELTSAGARTGKILLSVRLVPEPLFAAMTLIEPTMRVPMKIRRALHHVKIPLLGLRSLKPSGMFSIRRAEVHFHTTSLRGFEDVEAKPGFTDLIAHARNNGPNPSIGSVIHFSMPLPLELSHIPALSCSVFDEGALIKTRKAFLGSFFIDLAKYDAISRMLLIEKLTVILEARRAILLSPPVPQVPHASMTPLPPLPPGSGIQSHLPTNPNLLALRGDVSVMGESLNKRAGANPSMLLNSPDLLAEQPLIGEDLESSFDRALARNLAADPQLADNLRREQEAYQNLQMRDGLNPVQQAYAAGNLGSFETQTRVIGQLESLIHYLHGMIDLSESFLNQTERDFLADIRARSTLRTQITSVQPVASQPQPAIAQPQPVHPDQTQTKSSSKSGGFFSKLFGKKQLADTAGYPLPEESPFYTVSLPKPKIPDNPYLIVIPAKFMEVGSAGKKHLMEVTTVDHERYYEYGYHSKHANTKEYRRFEDGHLENSMYMSNGTFNSITITRGKRINMANSLVAGLISGDAAHENVGVFKGGVKVIEDNVLRQLCALELTTQERETFAIPRSLEEFNISPQDRNMLSAVHVSVFLYILEAEFYKSFDIASDNDAYMIIKLDKKTFRTERIADRNNPKFYKVFRFDITLPGPSELQLTFYDEDPLKPDDLMGSTSIDIEDRFFDRVWNSFPHKPIEKRNLFLKSSVHPTGDVKLWVDVVPQIDVVTKKYIPVRIEPMPPAKVQVRIVVWEIHGVPRVDAEGTVDIQVVSSIPSLKQTQSTDTHIRSQDGFGSFNYRLIYDLTVDEYSKPTDYQLFFKIFDRDLISADDFIADYMIDLREQVLEVARNDYKISIFGTSFDGKPNSKQFVVKPKFNPDTDLEVKYQGMNPIKLVLSIDVLPFDEAEAVPVGKGQNEPNQDPFLSAPVKRGFGIGINILGIIENNLGPRWKLILSLGCVGLYFLFILLLILPVFLSVLASMAITRTIV